MTYGREWDTYDLECCARMFSDRLVEWIELDHDVPNNVARVAEARHGWLGLDRWRKSV